MILKYVFLVILLQFGQLIALEGETDPLVENGNELEEPEPMIQGRLDFTFPGTKWCGQGNISKHENDFGIFKNVDLCCKAHDECDKLLPGESKDGLTNNSPVSKLACYCDDNLYYCLKRTGFPLGTLIKTIYVAGQTQCYKMEYPIVRCRRYKIRFLQRRCVEYELDETKPKKLQYFDLPFYDYAK